MSLDYAMAIEAVETYVDTIETMQAIRRADLSDNYFRNPRYIELDRIVIGETPLIEKIALQVDDRLALGIRATNSGAYPFNYKRRLEAAIELLARLRGREREEQILGETGPKMAAAKMHPWVWDHAAGLWDDGHPRAAVQQAATAIFDSHLPAKLGVVKGGRGSDPQALVGAFKSEAPTEATPRLRLPGFIEGTQDWTNAHEGAQHLGLACTKLVRNLGTHSVDEPEDQEALEELAMLSRFAHLCDDAAVVTA